MTIKIEGRMRFKKIGKSYYLLLPQDTKIIISEKMDMDLSGAITFDKGEINIRIRAFAGNLGKQSGNEGILAYHTTEED